MAVQGLKPKGWSAVVLTVSDSCSLGRRRDESGFVLEGLLKRAGFYVARRVIVRDEKRSIRQRLCYFSDRLKVDLVLTTGGTGLGPRDVTPEATREAIDREAQGLAEFLRFEGGKKTKRAVLSRGVAGLRKKTLIINFPGSPRAVSEFFDAALPLLPHAIEMIRGQGHDESLARSCRRPIPEKR